MTDRIEQHVTATAGFAYGVIGADIHVFGDGTPLYVLENWRPSAEPDAAWLSEQPSRMLNARLAVVGFTGRERELADLRGWCGSRPTRAARWLHAPGGQGKTRLAHELARDRAAAGWKVVTATEGPGGVLPPPGSQDLRTAGSAGLLLLVDYADRWPLASLTWLFSNSLLHRTDIPVRVLLLGRTADLWPALRASLANTQVSASSQALPPLDADGPGARTTMFRAARDAFADRYGIDPPSTRVDLTDDAFALTLAVHMAALVAVDADACGLDTPPQGPGRTSLEGLTIYLLDREQLNWARMHTGRRHGRIGTPPTVMNRTVYTASLVGTQPVAEGTMLVDALEFGHPTTGVLADHAVCYPPPDAAAGKSVLEPLYPDRLAEDFLALTLPGHTADYPAQRWACDTATEAVRRVRRPGRALTTLAAVAARWPHVGRDLLYPLLRADPARAAAAGNTFLVALAQLPDAAPELLLTVVAHIHDPVPDALVTGRALLRVRLLEHRLALAGENRAEQARILVNHGSDLRSLGRYEEAAEAGGQAVGIFEDLAAADPDSYEADVARSLTNYVHQLSDLGRNDEALVALQRVVAIFRRLADADPEQYGLDVATALANHALQLESAHRWEEARRASQEAIARYRDRMRTDPRARAGLAIALTTASALTLRDAGSGDRAEGARATAEAVALWRELTAGDPGTRQGHLAIALINLVGDLAAAGRPDEAVSAARESVEIYRRLARADPHAHEEGLATALGLLRDALVSAGRAAQAVTAGAECVTVFRRLAVRDPDRYERRLRGALRRQNDALRATGLSPDRRSPKASLRDAVYRPAVTVSVYGWDPTPVPGRLPPPERPTVAGRRLARAGDWAGYWQLIRSVPLVDAARLAGRIPVHRWRPPADADLEVLEMLRDLDPRRAARSVERLAEAATVRVPEELTIYNGYYAGFAHRRAALVVATIEPDMSEVVRALDLESGRETTLAQGKATLTSIGCLGASQAVGARRRDGPLTGFELVRLDGPRTRVLASGAALGGASLAATASGFVAGLRLAPAALVATSTDDLRQTDLAQWGLARGDLLAVNPAGDRLVISDRHRLVTVDQGLERALGVAAVPEDFGFIRDMVFCGPDRLLTSGDVGGLLVWDLCGHQPSVTAAHRGPGLRNLFALPAWGVVGGTDRREHRLRFHDPHTLRPVPPPVPLRAVAEHLGFVLSSADGRYVAYGGQLGLAAGHRPGTGDWHTLVHDFDHPGAVLQRPLSALSKAALTGLLTTSSEDAEVENVLDVACLMAAL
ncbi:tetratricopeptide repeat protein [Streptomyces venetus]|uniref:tetratricopeptide repeat protein n=1 Tax=Streptomyces venetus TaxID=1701086 RepID=UPI003C2C11E6